ncbi:PREDICTED: uncharacterized protein LOC102252620 [Myotis brandtii]|uniref:uncharacterized protein LOC102252620 n=1 Tax=Myotis brandtii TaxID=109478 RepID=UPI0003BC054E|nr:PREDICTED: uncharacterized protein LOC102252620 [Myotis brandtii]
MILQVKGIGFMQTPKLSVLHGGLLPRGELSIFEEKKCEVGYIKFIKKNPARVLLTPSYQDDGSTDYGCDSGNGCKWKSVKAIQILPWTGTYTISFSASQAFKLRLKLFHQASSVSRLQVHMQRTSNQPKLNLCQKYCLGGFAFLPFPWLVNIFWFFREAFLVPAYTEQSQTKGYVRHLAVDFLFWGTVLHTWITIFQIYQSHWSIFGDYLSLTIPLCTPDNFVYTGLGPSHSLTIGIGGSEW